MPGGKALVTSHGTDDLYFWEIATGKLVHRVKPGWRVMDIAISSDGTQLAVAGSQVAVRRQTRAGTQTACADVGREPIDQLFVARLRHGPMYP